MITTLLSTHATQYNDYNKTETEYSDRLESNPDGPGDGWIRGVLTTGSASEAGRL